MSLILSQLPCAPRSHPANPGGKHQVGEGTTATGRLTGAPTPTGPDEARHIKTRGPRARQSSMPLAETKAHGQVQQNNGHRVPQTWEGSTKSTEPGQDRRGLRKT